MTAKHASANAATTAQTSKRPEIAKPPATTAANTTAKTNAENASGPFWDVRLSVLELYCSMENGLGAVASIGLSPLRFLIQASSHALARVSFLLDTMDNVDHPQHHLVDRHAQR